MMMMLKKKMKPEHSTARPMWLARNSIALPHPNSPTHPSQSRPTPAPTPTSEHPSAKPHASAPRCSGRATARRSG